MAEPTALLEAALADIARHGGTPETVEAARSLVGRGLMRPTFTNGEYGFALTDRGQRVVALSRMEVRGHG